MTIREEERATALGSHEPWCTDHRDDIDGGWCRGTEVRLAHVTAFLTEADHGPDTAEVVVNADEEYRSLSLDDARRFAGLLGQLADDADPPALRPLHEETIDFLARLAGRFGTDMNTLARVAGADPEHLRQGDYWGLINAFLEEATGVKRP